LATLAATVAATGPRIEIVGERRRAHDARFRAQVVEASRRPGASVRELARQHGICVSLIYRWRRSISQDGPVGGDQACDQASPKRLIAAADEPSVQFVQLGTIGSPAREGEGAENTCGLSDSQPRYIRSTPSRPAMDERPGTIEIDLVDGTRLRVDAFVNERALRRVLGVLKAHS
jgi:transposase